MFGLATFASQVMGGVPGIFHPTGNGQERSVPRQEARLRCLPPSPSSLSPPLIPTDQHPTAGSIPTGSVHHASTAQHTQTQTCPCWSAKEAALHHFGWRLKCLISLNLSDLMVHSQFSLPLLLHTTYRLTQPSTFPYASFSGTLW